MKTQIVAKKKVAVIGHGYVGHAVYDFFKDHFDTVALDVNYFMNDRNERVSLHTQKDVDDIRQYINKTSDLVVLCVPTPMSDDGSAELSYVHSTFEWLTDAKLILIKSTVPPTTTEKLAKMYPDKNICFSPEYIGEGNYIVPVGKGYPDPLDMKKHEFVIIGGKEKNPQLVGEFFKTILGAETTYRFVDSTTAELCKYMENAFLATKVTFCNEFYNVATAMGVDYDTLRELWLLDGRIGRSHTSVFVNKRGFGGKCLPKDVNALVKQSEKMGYSPKLIKAVLSTNDDIINGQ